MFYVQDIIPLLVFLGVIAGIFAVLTMISNRNSRALERLQRMGRPRYELDPETLARAKNERFQGIVETAKVLSQPLMPQTELEQSALRIKLANAGFRSDTAPMVYSGIRVACLGLFFLVS